MNGEVSEVSWQNTLYIHMLFAKFNINMQRWAETQLWVKQRKHTCHISENGIQALSPLLAVMKSAINRQNELIQKHTVSSSSINKHSGLIVFWFTFPLF